MFNFFESKIVFSHRHLKIFVATSIAIFVMVAMQLIGIRAPKLELPIPSKPDVFFDTIQPKLNLIPNKYNLKKYSSFIAQAGASGNVDNASAYGVVDYDSGEIISSKNLSDSFPIASLTKVMTAIVALDLAHPAESFVVSKNASQIIPTKIGLQVGESMTLNELLHASLLTSANDAVEVIREGIDSKYDDSIFIRAMNEKAFVLGLNQTSFSNPQGFDAPKNYSSIEDFAVITHYALENYPLIKEIVKKDYELLSENDFHKRYDLYNWNGLIGVYPNITGVKIGNTDDAGRTTAVVSERNGKKLIAIILDAPGIIERDLWTAQILDLAYEERIGLASVGITEEQLRAKYQTWKYWN